MRRNCNLELQLLPASTAADSGDLRREEAAAATMTIFYGGRVCVTDVTELQARAILTLASREVEAAAATPAAGSPDSATARSPASMSPGGTSMRRSLQQFLQMRRNRAQATSPYHR